MKDLKVTIKIEGMKEEFSLRLVKEDVKAFLKIVGVFNKNTSKIIDEYIPEPGKSKK